MSYKKFIFVSIFLTVGFLIASSALAQSQMLMHMPVMRGVGSDAAVATSSVFVRAGSPYASFVDVGALASDANKLRVMLYYKNPGCSAYASSSCWHQGLGFHQCPIPAASGAATRQVAYYVAAIASTTPADISFYMPGGTQLVASTSPFYISIQNSNLGDQSISGRVVFQQAVMVQNTISATTTVPLTASPMSYTSHSVGNLGVNDYIWYSGTTTAIRITATSSTAIVVDRELSLTSGTEIRKLLPSVYLFISGTTAYVTSTATGTFVFSNLATTTSYNIMAFKEGMCDAQLQQVYPGTSNNTAYLTAGCGGGQTLETFRVVWTAPDNNMRQAPRDISFNQSDMSQSRSPILIGLSQTASSTTITTSTVMLKRVVSGSLVTVTSTAVHYYNPADASTFCIQSGMAGACLGPEAKIILYSSISLAADSQYIVEITSGVLSANNNALQGSRPAGGQSFMFTTSPDVSGMTTAQYGQGGAYMPPFVTGMMPNNNSFGVPRDSNILIMFSQPMDSTTVTTTNFKLYSVTSPFTSQEVETETAGIVASLDNNTKDKVTLSYVSGWTASTHYRVKVLGGAKSATGLTIGPANQPTQAVFRGDFETGSGTDTVNPTIMGTNLNKYLSGGSYTNVPVANMIEINFSEGINPSTISRSTVTLTVQGGTTLVEGTVEYDTYSNRARFVPSEALQTNATYTFTATTSIQDLAGNALDGDTSTAGNQIYTLTYTTAAAGDTSGPSLVRLNADNYELELEFNEPILAVSVADPKWASSSLNSANYTVQYGAAGTNFGANCGGGTAAVLTSAQISYDAGRMAVGIENVKAAGGATLTVGNDICVYVQDVIDLSNNEINATYDTVVTPIRDHSQTYGMFGGAGAMMGPPTTAGGAMGPSVGMHDPGQMGMMPVGAWPMNGMAGMTTMYFFDLPTTKALVDGGYIVFDFKRQGFNVTSAVPDPYSPMRNDWNGPGKCRIRLDAAGLDTDGISVDTTLETVTLMLDIDDGAGGACTASSTEFYHFDVVGIGNAMSNTTGYTVDIITKQADGSTILETNTSMPFMITSGGARTVTVGIYANASSTNAAINLATSSLTVMLGSPMTGPMEATANFAKSQKMATATFSGIPDGDYNFFTKPGFNLSVCDDAGCTASTSQSFVGRMMSEPVRVSGSNITKVFAISREDKTGATPVEVFLKGSFGTDQVDIFAGSPSSGFVVKTVTPGNLANFASQGSIYLPQEDTWNIGIGPAMPKGAMFMGPPTMPDWMPPGDIMVIASTTGGTSECIEASATSNDCKVNFEVRTAGAHIIGYVRDASGNAINDAGVDAFKVAGFGMPSHSQTDTTGRFDLKVALGALNTPETYGLSVFKPGLPPSPPKTVLITQNNLNPASTTDNLVDGNNTNNVYLEGGIPVTTANPLVVSVTKGGYEISGYVYEDTASDSKKVAYAPVWANNTATGEFIPSGTDSSGFFVIYVRAGTWRVSANVPELGELEPQTVTITSVSQSINLKPSSAKSAMATIDGSVTVAGASSTNAKIWVEGTAGTRRYENDTKVDSVGAYSLKVPAGTYTIHCFVPGYGEIGVYSSVTVVGGSTYTRSFTLATANVSTVYFKFTNAPASTTRAFVDLFDSTNNKGNGVSISAVSANTSTESINIPQGSYFVKAKVPGLGELNPTGDPAYSSATGKVTLSSAVQSITFTLPTAANQVLISGSVTSTAGVMSDAFVWIGSLSSGFHFNTLTDAAGNYSMRVPAGAYRIGADKPGYSSAVPADVTLTANTTRNFTLSANSNYVTGTISNAAGTAVSNAWVWAEKVTSATDMTPAGGWAGSQTDSNGVYSLSVGSGYWLVRAVGKGYQETRYSSIVSSASNPTVNITLQTMSGFTVKEPKQKPITPSEGGVFDDSSGETGVKIVIPAGFDDDQNQGTLMVQETTSLPKTNSKIPLGGKGKEINIYDSNNVAIKGSSSASSTALSTTKQIDLEISYSASDIPAGYTEDQLVLGYWNDSSNQWTEVDAVVDTDNNVIRAKTSHFSVYAPLLPNGVNPPTTPGTPSGTLSSNTIILTWAASTDDISVAGYEVYRSTSESGTYSNVSGDSTASGVFNSAVLVTNTTWTDTAITSGNTYYYKVAAYDNQGYNSTSSSASAGINYSPGGSVSPGGGGGGGDVTPPAISNIQVQAGVNTSTITWQTATESSWTWLVYGTSTAYGLEKKDTANKTSHSVSLTGLAQGTTYYYQVKSRDSSGNVGSYSDRTFTTLGAAPVVATTTATTTGATTTAPVTAPATPQIAPTKPISQMTVAEIKTEIARIAALIVQLQAQLSQMLAGAKIAGVPVGFSFAKTLKSGMADEDVKYLQIVLNSDPVFQIASSGVGSPGQETTYFGALTKAAVVKFQEKYASEILTPVGLTQGTGLVGSSTRAKLNSLLGK